MNAKQIRELCEQLDDLRRTLMESEGEDPDDEEDYKLYPPTISKDISIAEQRSGFRYPDTYRSFLELHNGWLGFWPDWSLAGIPRKDNKVMYEDVESTLKLLPTVADEETRAKLPEQEKTDPRVILVTNHLVLGTDFNGSLLVFDRNRIGKDGEPQIAWVRYVMHVERRWPNFIALMGDAIRSTEAEIPKPSSKNVRSSTSSHDTKKSRPRKKQ